MTHTVDFYFDPACPWAWMTSRWMLEAQKVRDVELTFKPMSLAALNEGRDLDEDYRRFLEFAWAPMRVVFAAIEHSGPGVVAALYTALGTRIHVQGRGIKDRAVFTEALAEVGLPESLIEAADDDRFDDAIRAAQAAVIELVGDDVGTPTITIDGSEHAVNGALTIGENIGDLGGISIAIKAYQIALAARGSSLEEEPVVDGRTALQRLFIQWALVWREKRRTEESIRLLAIDPHSPPEFRCNQVVKNVPEFHEAFGVVEGDGMWLAEEDRVRIW